ncbi:MAG: hypothetical protein GY714_18200 [Desulfobacterales bacterium]|nr:hypothetical protein [Desulfobacterales bacterium]
MKTKGEKLDEALDTICSLLVCDQRKLKCENCGLYTVSNYREHLKQMEGK